MDKEVFIGTQCYNTISPMVNYLSVDRIQLSAHLPSNGRCMAGEDMANRRVTSNRIPRSGYGIVEQTLTLDLFHVVDKEVFIGTQCYNTISPMVNYLSVNRIPRSARLKWPVHG